MAPTALCMEVKGANLHKTKALCGLEQQYGHLLCSLYSHLGFLSSFVKLHDMHFSSLSILTTHTDSEVVPCLLHIQDMAHSAIIEDE